MPIPTGADLHGVFVLYKSSFLYLWLIKTYNHAFNICRQL